MAILEKIEEKFIKEIDSLLAEASVISNTENDDGFVDVVLFSKWFVNCRTLIESLPINSNQYLENFPNDIRVSRISPVKKGIGILQGLKDYINKGLLKISISFIQTEIFSDFLEMAEHIFEQGHKDPPVMLAGAVLEDSLRKICIKNDVAYPADSNIGSLNQLLLQKQTYNKIVFKQIDTWKAIRDFADHADFDQYDRDKVKEMLEGIRRFIGEYLG
jgi:hypothetical protein